MIFPTPVNFWEITKFPLTWSMIFINLFIFMIFFVDVRENNSWMDFYSDQNLILSGRLFHQYVEKSPPEIRRHMPSWVQTLTPTEDDHFRNMGAWALRDSRFLTSAPEMEFFGDAVAIDSWKKGVVTFERSYLRQMVFHLGLSQINRNSLAWVTYQFSHSGFLHLASNMIYFAVIGAAVEAMIGAAGMVLIYLFGGLCAGVLFLVVNSHGGAIPMVGASGAISALVAFYVLFEQRGRVRFMYLVPYTGSEKFHGLIFLPTLWMIPLFLLSDFSHHLSAVEGMGGGVAYTAHIGGTLFGATAALICRHVLRMRNHLLWQEFFPPEPTAAAEPAFDDDQY